MKNLTTFIFLFLSLYSFSQSNNSIDFVVGIDQTYRNIFATESTDLANLLLASSEEEKPKMNWRLGVNYKKALSEKNYLKLGARLSSLGYKQTFEGLIFGSQLDILIGNQDTIVNENVPSNTTFSRDFWFVELPVSFGWIKSNEKFSIFAEAGLSPNVLITTRTKTVTDLDKSVDFQKIPGSRTFNLSAVIGFGLSYRLSERSAIFGQPSFRYHFTSLGSENIVKEHLYSYGIEFGLRKALKGK